MTESRNLKNLTRDWDWTTSTFANAELQTSALMRIADAMEKMVANYNSLKRNKEYYEREYRRRGDVIGRLERQLAAQKANVTKLRKRLAQGEA